MACAANTSGVKPLSPFEESFNRAWLRAMATRPESRRIASNRPVSRNSSSISSAADKNGNPRIQIPTIINIPILIWKSLKVCSTCLVRMSQSPISPLHFLVGFQPRLRLGHDLASNCKLTSATDHQPRIFFSSALAPFSVKKSQRSHYCSNKIVYLASS